MKRQLQKAAPKPTADFVEKLEEKLLAHGSWGKHPSLFFSMKRLSPFYGSLLLLLAVAGGLLYPFAPSDDYVANAQEYYENYKPDGILYQKVQRYMVHPKGYDMDTTYLSETWDYEGNYLSLTSKINGDLYEAVQDGNLVLTDDYGNIFMYGDPTEYATNRQPVVEAPYCIQHLTEETEKWTIHSTEAFEASPNAMAAFTAFLEQDTFYTFTHSGEVRDQMYIAGSSFRQAKTQETPVKEPDTEQDLWNTINEATTSPEQAKLLFDLLSEEANYTHEVRSSEAGQELHVFRLPPEPYNFDENGQASKEQLIQEFVFNDSYQLLEMNTYKDEQLVEQTKYLEEKILPLSEKAAIFNPETYGFELFAFDHPYDIVDSSFVSPSEQELTCYSFQNELLSEEETQKLAEEYAPLIENIKTYWKADLHLEEF